MWRTYCQHSIGKYFKHIFSKFQYTNWMLIIHILHQLVLKIYYKIWYTYHYPYYLVQEENKCEALHIHQSKPTSNSVKISKNKLYLIAHTFPPHLYSQWTSYRKVGNFLFIIIFSPFCKKMQNIYIYIYTKSQKRHKC